jgi:4'-phosphopantetheinyl transferase
VTVARPAAGEVHLWWADLDAAPAQDVDLLAPDERLRADRLARDLARSRMIARRATLRRLLGRYLRVEPAAVELHAGAHGKPACGDDRAPTFNASSSGSLAIFAFAPGARVGVDVEYRPDGAWERFPERTYLSEAECAALDRLPESDRRRRAAELWVIKEAVSKALGTGFHHPPRELELLGLPSRPRIALGGPWAAHASPALAARTVRAEGRRIAAVAVDGDWDATVERTWPAR